MRRCTKSTESQPCILWKGNISRAKAQRRKEKRKTAAALCVFAPLRETSSTTKSTESQPGILWKGSIFSRKDAKAQKRNVKTAAALCVFARDIFHHMQHFCAKPGNEAI
jgi:hypothetical protein